MGNVVEEKNGTGQTRNKIVVLIDGENIPVSSLHLMLNKVKTLGEIYCVKAYADWGNLNKKNWMKAISLSAPINMIQIQQYTYVKGKNTTDIRLAIDAIEMALSDDIDEFVIMSSDSDYMGLVSKLRGYGKKVYGIGEKKSIKSYVENCDKFFFVEDIKRQVNNPVSNIYAPKPIPIETVCLIGRSIPKVCYECKLVSIKQLDLFLRHDEKSFNSLNYGYKTLEDMIKALPRFKIITVNNYNYVMDLFVG